MHCVLFYCNYMFFILRQKSYLFVSLLLLIYCIYSFIYLLIISLILFHSFDFPGFLGLRWAQRVVSD